MHLRSAFALVLSLPLATRPSSPVPRSAEAAPSFAEPAVSPDGARVVFQVHHDGAWILELRDGSMRKVLADPSAEEYAWSPDGRRLAYHSRSVGGWGVWVMAAR